MANQALQNLKKIHDLQQDGEITKILKMIKNSKTTVEEFGAKLSKRIKELSIDNEKETKVEKKVVVEEKPGQTFVADKVEQISFKRFDQNANKPFDKNKQNMQRNNNFANRDKKDFNRPNQNNKPFNNGQNKKYGSNNFVSSKANSFRSFTNTVELSELDVKNDRNYSAKAKFDQKHKNTNYDEKKNQNKKGKEGGKRSNIFIEDENGFEEISFGSRKNVKKKKEATQVNNVVTIKHAVFTSREITVKDFSEKIGKPVTEIVKKLMMLGIMATINSNISVQQVETNIADIASRLPIEDIPLLENKEKKGEE